MSLYHILQKLEADVTNELHPKLKQSNRLKLSEFFASRKCPETAKMIKNSRNDETWSGLWLMMFNILEKSPSAYLSETEKIWIGLIRNFKFEWKYRFSVLGADHPDVQEIATPGVTWQTEIVAGKLVGEFARLYYSLWVKRKIKEHGSVHFPTIPKDWQGSEMLFTLYWYADSSERKFVNAAMDKIDNVIFNDRSFGDHLFHLNLEIRTPQNFHKWVKWWKSKQP